MGLARKKVWSFTHLVAGVALLASWQVVFGQAVPPAGAVPIEFAPGILTTIKPDPQDEEMFSGPRPLVEVPIAIEGLEYDPKLNPKTATVFERAKVVTLRRTIWNLEFSFKPMRMIYVDIPQPTGKMQRKLVWYMVYRVRNLGGHIKPEEIVETIPKESEFLDDTTHTKYQRALTDEVEMFGRTTTDLRFFPHFVLASPEYKKEYLDRVIPAALEPIREREFPGGRQVELYNSLTISEKPIPKTDETGERGLWGVVTWVDVDPKIDYYIVYVQGLTNAYKFTDPEGGYKKGDAPGTGRQITKKTLQLNFWRPGDTVDPHEEEIRYGCPVDPDPIEQQRIFALYGIDKPIDYQWLYR